MLPAQPPKDTPNGLRVTIAASVVCCGPSGTKGFVFISLEDETGIAAVVVRAFFERLRLVITQESALKISGPLQNVASARHVKAGTIEPLREAAPSLRFPLRPRSRVGLRLEPAASIEHGKEPDQRRRRSLPAPPESPPARVHSDRESASKCGTGRGVRGRSRESAESARRRNQASSRPEGVERL
jgi:hypothetical protein